MELEADLIRKRLAVEQENIQEEESARLQDEDVCLGPNDRVDDWFMRMDETRDEEQKQTRFEERARRRAPLRFSPTPQRAPRHLSPSPERVRRPRQSPERVRHPSPSPERVRRPRQSPERVRHPSPSPERVRRPRQSPERVRHPSLSPERVRRPRQSPERVRHLSPSPERERHPSAERRRRTSNAKQGIEQLAEALERMARPRIRNVELPIFSGNPNEWLPFKATMRDSTRLYNLSAAENLQRLRTCLRGEAREAVAALLYTATDPSVIMKTLEQCFGRPEVLIDRALEEIRRLPRLGPSAIDLNNFAIKLRNQVCILEAIDKRGFIHNPLLAREVLGKLSPHHRSRWCDYAALHEEDNVPEIVMMSRFLTHEANLAISFMYAPSASTVAAATAPAANRSKELKASTSGRSSLGRKPDAVYNTSERAVQCPSCGEDHKLPQCQSYKALTVNQRWDFVKERGLCFKCVASKHRRIACKARVCGVNQCRRPHHATLHEDPPAAAAAEPQPSTSGPETVMSVATTATGPRTVLLKVCPVIVSGPRGEVSTYALLDEGATVTLIDNELAESIGANGPTRPLNLRGVNMEQQEEESRSVAVQLRGKNEHAPYGIRARTVKNLILHQQTIPKSLLRKYKHLRLDKNEMCYELARPKVLVGTDHWELIVSRELRVGGPNEPAASRTQLGWVVHGSVPRNTIIQQGSVLHIYDVERHGDTTDQYDRRLEQLVEAHFKIDALGVSHKPLVGVANQRARDIVQKTMKKIDGAYEVGLPWRRDDVTMPPSYDAAFRRLRSIERKMDASPDFAKQYTAQMENLLNKGYAAPCDGHERASTVSWFLPHFAVQNPNKPGKLRLVFDAAARSHGVCLNDELLEGPDLLLSLQGIVFRFRERPVAVTADIQEMFLRVKIRPEDQPAQQFLWRGNDRENPPRCFKMTSMIFGAASSPFMAHSVRDHNAHAHAHTHPRALEAITHSHYMDDFVASYEDIEEGRRTISEVIEVHADAGFTLRGWNSNYKGVLDEVPVELRATQPTQLGGEGHAEHKILGLYWNAGRDELGFNTSLNRVPDEVRTRSRAPTKREALSAVMSIYDPLGPLSHYTIRAKIILQGLWRLKLPWDEPIPEEEAEQFMSWLAQLEEIARLRLPRCYGLKNHQRIELHIFCDASEQAYATVAYWRIVRCDGSIGVTLVGAKSKVVPQRTQTIPRLELQAAVIGVRLADTLKKEHRIKIDSVTYWTDSATVIHWVRNDARRYTPFVAHRLSEIAELTEKDEWRWLPTTHNVADDATRCHGTTISVNDRWFQGPDFLYESPEHWPAEQSSHIEEEDVLHTGTRDGQKEDWLPDPGRFSKYETLIRAAARVLAFIDMCRKKTKNLEVEHLERAERALLQRAQRESFGAEIERIQAGRSIPKTSRLYKLDPELQDGILRVRGRIGAATVPEHMKRPIILDGRHHLTKLLVLREHCAAGHANRERVTNDLRQRYWIVHLRPTVRAVEHACALCKVRRAMPRSPATGNLPQARLEPYHRPFTNCGVDYFGPMMVKIGRRREKRWGALFTCLTTRAIHVELAASLSTDSALMALRRMAARRGWPRVIYSDNATNFRGADHELKAAYREWAPALQQEGMLHRTEWRFIPPGAPNQGGAWERMVRSVKVALGAVLKEKAPPEEVLQTLLTEVEFSVNARPLTHVSVDPNDPEALTPNHFLLGGSMGLPTTGPCDEADRRAWRASQALADHFWQRWLKEYLPTLVPRGEPTNNDAGLKEGDIVVVVDSTLPRNVWPMGEVIRTFSGPDGGIRVADVRTKTGIFRRPTRKLAVLIKKEASQATPGGEM
ncbi:uncharacterized protein LOC126376924 [Pectinophora gossypiella]|uniref:uncharacterized protein LOC126376924 n=1 Tax=Pectinophora gossypiella TaxID=13191 RepID=UPI00214EAA76|nr:uncharacterized protein LOC126376924 [Pectinophora gossypiella]